MRCIKKLAFVLAMMLMVPVLSLAAPTCVVESSAASLSGTSLTMSVGEKYKLKLDGVTGDVKWKSKNTSVATVNSKGKVKAKAVGTATIIAKSNGKKITYTVTVTAGNASGSVTGVATVKDNVALIVNTIKSRGTKYGAGVYLEDKRVFDGGTISMDSSIRYFEGLNSIRFISELRSGEYTFDISMEYKIGSNTAEPLLLMMTSPGSGIFISYSTINMDTITNENVNLRWRSGYSYVSSSTNDTLNSWFGAGLQSYDLMLYDLFGMRLGDIGFKQYPTTR